MQPVFVCRLKALAASLRLPSAPERHLSWPDGACLACTCAPQTIPGLSGMHLLRCACAALAGEQFTTRAVSPLSAAQLKQRGACSTAPTMLRRLTSSASLQVEMQAVALVTLSAYRDAAASERLADTVKQHGGVLGACVCCAEDGGLPSDELTTCHRDRDQLLDRCELRLLEWSFTASSPMQRKAHKAASMAGACLRRELGPPQHSGRGLETETAAGLLDRGALQSRDCLLRTKPRPIQLPFDRLRKVLSRPACEAGRRSFLL